MVRKYWKHFLEVDSDSFGEGRVSDGSSEEGTTCGAGLGVTLVTDESRGLL